jgi:hypothetical protein
VKTARPPGIPAPGRIAIYDGSDNKIEIATKGGHVTLDDAGAKCHRQQRRTSVTLDDAATKLPWRA